MALIAPVYICATLQQVQELEDVEVKDSILQMARANGIPARDVYEFDASRQSNRVSANVSGFAKTHANLAERQPAEALHAARD